jgi:hypothetical protein
MKRNMASADRIIRVLIAITFGLLYYFEVIEGTLAYVLLALGAIFLITSFIGFCPLYRLFGISTCKTS